MMMYFVAHLLLSALSIWAVLLIFYLWYIASIQLYKNWSSLATWVKVCTALSVICFVIFDWLMQHSLVALIFFDWPRDTLVTQRLERYRDGDADSWRGRVATLICTQALNPFDPTKNHC